MKKQAAATYREEALRAAGESRAWLIVTTYAKKEAVVLSQLKGIGYEGYRPMIAKRRKIAGQEAPVLVPLALYPNYVFVRALEGRSPLSLFGLQGLACVHERAVLDAVVQAHRAKEADGFLPFKNEGKAFRRGDRIKTLGGLLEVVLSDPIDTNRCAALSSFMNGSSRLIVGLDRAAGL
ncbi:ngn domain-containing protein [Asticcacaulis excentricus]|uniref:NGN domain-containing protein n=1 Tax=Asticcacaulis excentricus (strain ATCC 15261 / DSM 4724 / KCTC 12464 / NCIMB 9791 / VKM B-1370 / CB 48) TaxID=573065 RepID=E8RPP6_ASTEC|nr:ngn domain-containing protein [Asticcacaulis excentricus]ADU12023.1 NGN domain-containing protein [Asticcacaulis excentricus CB 48]